MKKNYDKATVQIRIFDEATAEPTNYDEAISEVRNYDEVTAKSAKQFMEYYNNGYLLENIRINKRSAALLFNMVEGEDGAALVLRAYCYKNGYGTDRDYSKYLELMDQAVDMGYAYAQYLRGLDKIGSSYPWDIETANDLLMQAGCQGLAIAQGALGASYISNKGGEFNPSAGFQFLWTADLGGSRAHLCELALCYYYGYGTEVNRNKAADIWQELSDNGDTSAMMHLARCYRYGYGVSSDILTAKNLYKRCGDPIALAELACMYTKNIIWHKHSEIMWAIDSMEQLDKGKRITKKL